MTTVNNISEVEFGVDLPAIDADTSLVNVQRFCEAAGWDGPRFNSHEAAREMGLPGAIVPGVMSQGLLAAMIHSWAPTARIVKIDTVFRAPVFSDHAHHINGVVTDMDEDAGTVEVDLTITNDAGETRVFGTASIEFPG